MDCSCSLINVRERSAQQDPSLPRAPLAVSVAAGSVMPATGTAFAPSHAANGAVAAPAAAANSLVFDRGAVPAVASSKGSLCGHFSSPYIS
jgi:hypothetical protein